jgi:small subunit ribosomal protein S6
MRTYEVMFIAHPELDEASLTALVDKAKGWVTASGGQVIQVDLWGRRRLAYPIHKQTEGQYILMQTELSAAGTHEVERNFRLTEQIMRFQIIRTETPVAA